MTTEDLDRLEKLEERASAAPWHVRQQLDDDMCMGAIAVALTPDVEENASMRAGTWPSKDVVAACLIQSPPYATVHDDRFQENAELIALVRNSLSDLIKLARLGLERDS
jgi:hypothetical protein